MTASAYTLAELEALGPPIAVEDGTLACDRIYCDRLAAVLVPGGAFCSECFESFVERDPDGGGIYEVPGEELCGGNEWRLARDLEYAERLRTYSVERRYPQWDERLTLLAADAVDELIRSTGGVP